MARMSKSNPGDPLCKAVVYARVSSKGQEKEGYSKPAQLKLLREYTAANGFAVAQEYVGYQPSTPRAMMPLALT
jgi:site-specific DNA recombinase